MSNFKYINAYLTDQELRESLDELNTRSFNSNLKVFRDHFGFRNGELHTFVGTKGSGKSTWSKTILSEILAQGKRVFLYISEEPINKYITSLNVHFRKVYRDKEMVEDSLSRMYVVSEMDDFDMCNEKNFFPYLDSAVAQCKIDLLLFDNFTTSFLSEININDQSKTLRRFKELAMGYNIPVLMFFHTSKGSNLRDMNGDNVRGSATAVNIGSYNYVIHQVRHDEKIRNYIYTEKARYHSIANKKLYEVTYNYDSGIFEKCTDANMKDLKVLIKNE
jgi:energy-coupling factor transporter ATP-binding protein EcfA2